MIRIKCKNPKYVCRTPKFITSPNCISLPVSESEIEDVLLNAIHIQAKSAVDMDKVRVKKNKQITVHNHEFYKEIKRYVDAIKSFEQSKLERYGDYSDGKITLDEFMLFKESCNTKTSELNVKIKESKVQISASEAMLSDMATVTDEWHRALDIEKLSKDLVDTLVDSITIFDSEHIEIKWKYADEYFPR